MQITTFKDMYIAELQELKSLEAQLAEALLGMADAAAHPSLKILLVKHREKTQLQEDRLESILARHKARAREHTDQAMQALISETEKMLVIVKGHEVTVALIERLRRFARQAELVEPFRALVPRSLLDLDADAIQPHK